jgi:hypothetical protein
MRLRGDVKRVAASVAKSDGERLNRQVVSGGGAPRGADFNVSGAAMGRHLLLCRLRPPG